jgi:hypothetical protein
MNRPFKLNLVAHVRQSSKSANCLWIENLDKEIWLVVGPKQLSAGVELVVADSIPDSDSSDGDFTGTHADEDSD